MGYKMIDILSYIILYFIYFYILYSSLFLLAVAASNILSNSYANKW